MIEATSCGGVVIFRGKILVLYKNYKNKYEGWVLPKGTVEPGGRVQGNCPQGGQGRDRRHCVDYQVYRQEPVHVQHSAGYGGEGRPLVSDDGGQLLQ